MRIAGFGHALFGIAVAGLAILSLVYGDFAPLWEPSFAFLARCHVRYSAVSLAYQISAIVGGGLGPIAATAVYARYHSNFWVSALIAGACAMSLLCASMLKETHGTDLDGHSELTVA